MAKALTFYASRNPALSNCESTAKFCIWMNNLFDALNRLNRKLHTPSKQPRKDVNENYNEGRPEQQKSTHGVKLGDEDYLVSVPHTSFQDHFLQFYSNINSFSDNSISTS